MRACSLTVALAHPLPRPADDQYVDCGHSLHTGLSDHTREITRGLFSAAASRHSSSAAAAAASAHAASADGNALQAITAATAASASGGDVSAREVIIFVSSVCEKLGDRTSNTRSVSALSPASCHSRSRTRLLSYRRSNMSLRAARMRHKARVPRTARMRRPTIVAW
jgi:hypothetical protein